MSFFLSRPQRNIYRKQSAPFPVSHDAYVPLYTTPFSSTDMLMLFVPLVVRFRAESCLPSKQTNKQTKRSQVSRVPLTLSSDTREVELGDQREEAAQREHTCIYASAATEYV